MTFAPGASSRTRRRLSRSAPRWIVAAVARLMLQPFRGSLETPRITVRRIIRELRVMPEERQPHRAGRTVTLLADDDLGRALVRRIRVVVLVAVNEDDHVGVLLDRA